MKSRFLLWPALLALAWGASGARAAGEYQGPDAGRVVIGMGQVHEAIYGDKVARYTQFGSWTFYYRRPDTSWSDGVLHYQWAKVLSGSNAPDYGNERANGVVLTKSLAPGKYEIYNFEVPGTMGKIKAAGKLSIPFTVEPNQTTYLGNFQAYPLGRKGVFGQLQVVDVVFGVSDRQTADIDILKAKMPGNELGTVIGMTMKPAELKGNLFVEASRLERSMQARLQALSAVPAASASSAAVAAPSPAPAASEAVTKE